MATADINPLSDAKLWEWGGERLTIGEWSRRVGVPAATIHQRLFRGWSFGRALTPVRPRGLGRLTARQSEILDFIGDSIRERRRSPSIREIGDHFGMKSPNSVTCHLKALRRRGLIEWDGHTARSIRLAGHAPCPHCGGLGTVPAGEGGGA